MYCIKFDSTVQQIFCILQDMCDQIGLAIHQNQVKIKLNQVIFVII